MHSNVVEAPALVAVRATAMMVLRVALVVPKRSLEAVDAIDSGVGYYVRAGLQKLLEVYSIVRVAAKYPVTSSSPCAYNTTPAMALLVVLGEVF